MAHEPDKGVGTGRALVWKKRSWHARFIGDHESKRSRGIRCVDVKRSDCLVLHDAPLE